MENRRHHRHRQAFEMDGLLQNRDESNQGDHETMMVEQADDEENAAIRTTSIGTIIFTTCYVWLRRFCRCFLSSPCTTNLFGNATMTMFVITPQEVRVLIRVVLTTSLLILIVRRFDDADAETNNNNNNADDRWSVVSSTLLYHLLVDVWKSIVFTVLVISFFLRKTDEISWIRYVIHISTAVGLGLLFLGGTAVLVTSTITIFTIHMWNHLFLQAEMELSVERQKLPPRARVKALDVFIKPTDAAVVDDDNDDASSSLLLLVAFYTGHVVLWWSNSKSNSDDKQLLATAVPVNDNNNRQLPIRSVQFLVRNFFVAASDDGQLHLLKWTTTTTTSSSPSGGSDKAGGTRLGKATTATIMKRIQTVHAHDDFIRSVKHLYRQQQHYLLTCSDDLTIKLWHVDILNNNSNTVLRCCQVYQGHEHYILQIAVDSETNPSTFASCSLDGSIKIWHVDYDYEVGTIHRSERQAPLSSSSSCVSTLIGHDNGVNCIDFGRCRNLPYLVSGSDDRTIKIWDYEKQLVLQTLVGHEDGVTAVTSIKQRQQQRDECSSGRPPIPMMIVSASEDGTCRLWDGHAGACHLVVNFNMGRAWTLVVASSLQDDSMMIKLAVGFDEGCVCLDLNNNTIGKKDDPENNMLCGGDGLVSPLMNQPADNGGEQWKVEQAFILSQVDMVTNCCGGDVEPQQIGSPSPTALETERRLSLEHELRRDENRRPFCYVTVPEGSLSG